MIRTSMVIKQCIPNGYIIVVMEMANAIDVQGISNPLSYHDTLGRSTLLAKLTISEIGINLRSA